jgi:hypothetical protein
MNQENLKFVLQEKKILVDKINSGISLTRDEQKKMDFLDCMIELFLRSMSSEYSTVTIPSKEIISSLFEKKISLEKSAEKLRQDFVSLKKEYSNILKKINDMNIPTIFLD